jgi:16S rRNA (cytidine1402-2'-O)-methyltransferase
MPSKGNLYLVPTTLGETLLTLDTIPPTVIARIHALRHFVAERPKTTRHFVKATEPPYQMSELYVEELSAQTQKEDFVELLKIVNEWLTAGHDVGLMSEAGCPAVADPGAKLVAWAHQSGVTVLPLVGPSSILLALMASGMDGQHFAFHGYLPAKKPELAVELKKLELASQKNRQTQLFIETPYRNNPTLIQAIQTLAPTTRFCIACDLTLPTQYILTQTVAEWRKNPLPDLHKRPTIFLLQG